MAGEGKRFEQGQTGNPAGRPKGARHKVTLAVETLLEGEAEALTRKAVEMALDGDTVAMRLCLDRIAPVRKDRPIVFALPPIATTADLPKATAALLEAVAAGDLTLAEASDISRTVDAHVKAIEVTDLHARLAKLEDARP